MKLFYLKKFGLKKDPLLGKLQQGKNIRYKGHRILVKNATTLIPGKKITIILDTIYFKNIAKNAKDSDILIVESTFSSELKSTAKECKHLTSDQAAKIAKQAKAKKLILTHIGSRHTGKELLKQAKKVFKNTTIAKDLDII